MIEKIVQDKGIECDWDVGEKREFRYGDQRSL